MTELFSSGAETENRPWHRRYPTIHGLVHHPNFIAGALGITVILVIAFMGIVLSGYDPNAFSIRARLQGPGPEHWFGTDNLGRDIWTRVAHGTQVSFTVGLAVVAINGIAGTMLGALAGFYRLLDGPIMRVMDALMAFPAILLALGIAAALGPSLANVVLALAITYMPQTARIVRSSVLVVRNNEYVDAATSFGARDSRIILRHIVPNALSPLLVQLTSVFAYAVLAESTLSYLGVGLPPPTPSWGAVIADGRDYIVDAWWVCLFPGLAITITVLSLNFLGDGLRDVLDPRLKANV
jgi:peptide/nickel transport system permease protein